jgi:hypothetical protein
MCIHQVGASLFAAAILHQRSAIHCPFARIIHLPSATTILPCLHCISAEHHPKANAVSTFAILVRSPYSKPHRRTVTFDFLQLFLADLLQADRKPFSLLLSKSKAQLFALLIDGENLSDFVTGDGRVG